MGRVEVAVDGVDAIALEHAEVDLGFDSRVQHHLDPETGDAKAGGAVGRVVDRERVALAARYDDGRGNEDVLPADLYWIRTLDCGPVLISADEIPPCPA